MFKRNFLFMVTFALAVSAYAGVPMLNKSSESVIEKLLEVEDQLNSESVRFDFKAKLAKSVAYFKMKQDKWKDDKRTLEYVFYKVHSKYLKNYVPYKSFGDLLEKGTYGCLTASALYSVVLDELGYKYDIIETNYHMYVMVYSGDTRFILETTDPFNGFISAEKEIEKRLQEIASIATKPTSKDGYEFEFDINRKISADEMIGLQYYNMAVNAYNDNQLIEVVAQLDKANLYYNSERINEFLWLVIKRIAEDRPLLIELNLTKQQYPILATL